jgi:hypothetical protein
MKILKKKITLILMLLILIIMHLNNSFLDFYTLLKFGPNERMIKAYGDCGGESYGFIDKIKKLHNKKLNLEILNENPNFTFNNSTWFAYDIKNVYDKKKIILINNTTSLKHLEGDKYQLIFKNKNFGYYKVLKKEKNCFYLEKYD